MPRFVSYFGTRYPFAKLDLVAVPDLVPGGMENAGAIFLRDDRVLLDPATAPTAQLPRRRKLIAHELAHQWLGDLVTMRWWDDLWLSEATATLAANEALDDWHPDWKPWIEFQQSIDEVMGEDELRATRPVRTPISDGPAARGSGSTAMTYVKGAAILHMLDGWLGAGTIRPRAARVSRRPSVRRRRRGRISSLRLDSSPRQQHRTWHAIGSSGRGTRS